MIKLQDLLEGIITEGVLDKSILKCVFMAGGPGSGKSWVAENIFGVPNDVKPNLSWNMKYVNSDEQFERYLKDYGFDTIGWGTLDINQWPEDVLIAATGFDKKGNKVDPGHEPVRDKAKRLTMAKLKGYQKGRLGLIIDGTGDKIDKIKTMKKEAEHLGYDCYMVLVNTNLEVAKMRNETRPRALPEDVLVNSWNNVQKNIKKFQTMFRGNMKIVDNSKFLKPEDAKKKFKALMASGISSFIKRPIKNPIGKTWIKNQLALIKNKKRH